MGAGQPRACEGRQAGLGLGRWPGAFGGGEPQEGLFCCHKENTLWGNLGGSRQASAVICKTRWPLGRGGRLSSENTPMLKTHAGGPDVGRGRERERAKDLQIWPKQQLE